MRKFVGSTVALEAIDPKFFSISLEEEQVMQAEATEAAAEVETGLDEAERLLDVSDALEDVAVVADGIEEATPAETQLIELVGDVATAGTDEVTSEEVIPAMESFKGTKIATEGIRETARNIWANIQRVVKQVWEKIEKFFYNIFGTIPRLRKQIEALEEQVDNLSGKKVEDKKVTLSTGVKALSANYVTPKDEGDLSKNLNALSDACNYVFKSYMNEIGVVGEIVKSAIEDFDPAKYTEAPTALATKLAKFSDDHNPPKQLPGKGSADTKRYPGFDSFLGAALPGNVSLCSKLYSGKKDNSVMAVLDGVRRSGLELVDTADKAKSVPNDFTMATMSSSGMSDILKECNKLLDTLEEYRRGKGTKEIQKTRKDLESVSAKATAEMEKAKNSEEDRAMVPFYRSLLNFNPAFARWAQSPATSLLSSALTTIRANLVAVQRSISAYKAV